MSNFTFQELVYLEFPSEVRLSSNGTMAAFVLSKANKPDKDTSFQKAIYLVEVNTHRKYVLPGTEVGTNHLPCWSPDSSTVAFISNRANADEMQLYLWD